MTITEFELDFGNFFNVGSPVSSLQTNTKTPTANRLQLLYVFNKRSGAGAANTPTVTGCGLTWVQVNHRTFAGSSQLGCTLFRALGASPSSGKLTIDFGGQNQQEIPYFWSEFDGISTAGTNGSGAIVQSVNGDVGSSTGTFTLTLAAFADAGNAAYGGFSSSTSATAGSGFTQIRQVTAEIFHSTEWKNSSDTTVDITHSSSSGALGIAVEIAIAVPFTATGAAALIKLSAQGTGITGPGPGAGVASLIKIAGQGTGSMRINGAGLAALIKVAASGSGVKVDNLGGGAATLVVVSANGVGNFLFVAQLPFTLQRSFMKEDFLKILSADTTNFILREIESIDALPMGMELRSSMASDVVALDQGPFYLVLRDTELA